MGRRFSIAGMVTAVAIMLAFPATAQDQWQTRNWEQLKAETQARADRGAYPVLGIKSEDAREALSEITSLDHDEWGAAWMQVGDRYADRADAEVKQDATAAAADYLAAWRLYTMGRWPLADSPKKQQSYQKAQTAFQAYGQLVTPKIELVAIPFEDSQILVFLQKPTGIAKPPIVINIAGSDSFKDYAAIQTRALPPHGIASLTVDIPGVADVPVPARPGAERIYSRIIDYLKGRQDIDGDRIIVRGQSWGSYWSARVAYAEAARLKGAIYQSGPVDLYFQRSFQEQAFKTKEFLFDYVPSRLHMLGVKTVEEAFEAMPALSLKAQGLLDKPTPPMLLLTGFEDTQVPFEDFLLLLKHGSPKYAWVNPGGGTMGRSATLGDQEIFETVVVPWIAQQFTMEK